LPEGQAGDLAVDLPQVDLRAARLGVGGRWVQNHRAADEERQGGHGRERVTYADHDGSPWEGAERQATTHEPPKCKYISVCGATRNRPDRRRDASSAAARPTGLTKRAPARRNGRDPSYARGERCAPFRPRSIPGARPSAPTARR